ncbi:MAG: hypothetical protein JO323_08555 [Acidobacteriia bacterium]|nr:hypothetical protein [Terriglobia bacterium]
MPLRPVWITVRSVLSGWAALLVSSFVIERLFLILTARLLGYSWLPTLRVGLDCGALFLAGWIIGRTQRSGAWLALWVFAASLSVADLQPLLILNVPWLLQLAADAWRSPEYWNSLAATAATDGLLFGSLVFGCFLAGSEPKPISLLKRD